MTTPNTTQKELNMKYIELKNPYGIKTPTNVDEFRDNLRKYYLSHNDELITSIEVDNTVLISEISSVKDLIIKGVRMVTPLIGFKDNDVVTSLFEWMEKTKKGRTFTDFVTHGFGFFKDESNFELYKGFEELCEGTKGNPSWYGWDSLPLKEFYYITLGKFSGWDFTELKTHLTNDLLEMN